MTTRPAFIAKLLEAAGRATPERVMQTELGALGNCQSACLAMMLGCKLSQIPNFTAIEGTDDQKYAAQQTWLNERGLWIITFVKWQGLPWPPSRGFYIAGGVSPRGYRHSVIYRDGEPWHDPHPEGGGIDEVSDIDVILPTGFVPILATSPANILGLARYIEELEAALRLAEEAALCIKRTKIICYV